MGPTRSGDTEGVRTAVPGDTGGVHRVVVLGRGAAGKTTLSVQLGRVTGIPVVELDAHFWSADLVPLDRDRWVAVQGTLAAADDWIMDGDLGPYDVLAPRLARADTVVLLDFALLRCVWNAARRSRERADFWWWVLTWRVRYRQRLLQEICRHAPAADVVVLRSPRALAAYLSGARRCGSPA
jgi:adenylate kinase family enzyme